jgi:hypothetical protein
MYKVSPKPKPIMPLTPARTATLAGKLVKTPTMPVATKKANRTVLVSVKRTMLAETGLVSNSAFRYSRADTVQLTVAPRAANSPIIPKAFNQDSI